MPSLPGLRLTATPLPLLPSRLINSISDSIDPHHSPPLLLESVVRGIDGTHNHPLRLTIAEDVAVYQNPLPDKEEECCPTLLQ